MNQLSFDLLKKLRGYVVDPALITQRTVDDQIGFFLTKYANANKDFLIQKKRMPEDEGQHCESVSFFLDRKDSGNDSYPLGSIIFKYNQDGVLVSAPVSNAELLERMVENKGGVFGSQDAKSQQVWNLVREELYESAARGVFSSVEKLLEVKKLLALAGELGVQNTSRNLMAFDFSGIDFESEKFDLSNAVFVSAQFVGSKLKGVVINENTVFGEPRRTALHAINARFDRDFSDDFYVTYRFEDEMEVVLNGRAFFHFLNLNQDTDGLWLSEKHLKEKYGKNNVLAALADAQAHPDSDIAKGFKDYLYHLRLEKIQGMAVAPKKCDTLLLDEDNPMSVNIAEYAKAAQSKGLVPSQLIYLIKRASLNDGQDMLLDRQVLVARGLRERELPFTLNACAGNHVVNIEKVLQVEASKSNQALDFIDADDLVPFIADLSKFKNEDGARIKIDLIQLPMKLANQDHYVQLQIYANKNGSVGARIIDSKSSSNLPAHLIQTILKRNAGMLGAVLFDPPSHRAEAGIVETVYTDNQGLFDRKSGVYVAAGMRAATQAVLWDGVSAVRADSMNSLIAAQHRSVSQVNVMGSLIRLTGCQSITSNGVLLESGSVTPNFTSDSAKPSAVSVLDDARSMSTVDVRGDAFQSNAEDSGFDLVSEAGVIDQHQASKNCEQIKEALVAKSGCARISKLIDGVSEFDHFPKAVLDALKTYVSSFNKDNFLKASKHRGVKVFFRQVSGAGFDEARQAIKELECAFKRDDLLRKKAVASDIAKRILMPMLNDDKFLLNVKENSRAYHLLHKLIDNQPPMISFCSGFNWVGFSKSGGVVKLDDISKDGFASQGRVTPR